MDTEKYIELTRRCCQKYGGIAIEAMHADFRRG